MHAPNINVCMPMHQRCPVAHVDWLVQISPCTVAKRELATHRCASLFPPCIVQGLFWGMHQKPWLHEGELPLELQALHTQEPCKDSLSVLIKKALFNGEYKRTRTQLLGRMPRITLNES